MIKPETNVKEVIQKLHRFPTMLLMAGRRSLSDASIEVVQIMRRSGLSVKYPVKWDSEKQRRAFFATKGFGKGIPYKRDGGYEEAWKNESIANGFMMSNIGHKAVFLAGTASGNSIGGKVTRTGQSHIHEGRWLLVNPIVKAVVSRLPQTILDAFHIEFNR